MANVYTVTAVFEQSDGPSDTVEAICTTREAAEATVERRIRDNVMQGKSWIGDHWSYRVDEYPLCITPNEAYASKEVRGEGVYYGGQAEGYREGGRDWV